MRIVLIGHGGREHAMARALAASRRRPSLYAYMSFPNPGMARLSCAYRLGKLHDTSAIVAWAQEISADLVICGSEEPLVLGMADALQVKRIPVLGPTKALARLEGDKSYLRRLMQERVGWGFPRFQICAHRGEVVGAIRQFGQVAIKPIGLTGGKGVRVSEKQLASEEEAWEYAGELIRKDGRVLIEQKLEGEEFSLMALSDGSRLLPMPLVQDYKQAFEGDQGPMTGGMGSYSCPNHLLPFVSTSEREEALSLLHQVVMAAQEEANEPYGGFIYGQFMLTGRGPRLVEVNARLGDPEAMNVLALLEADFVDLCTGASQGKVPPLAFASQATVCKYLVPMGYPDEPQIGQPFRVDEAEAERYGVHLYYASVRAENSCLYTTSSRSLAVLAVGATVEEAEDRVEVAITAMDPEGLYHRSDIAKGPDLKAKVERVRKLKLPSIPACTGTKHE